MAVSLCPAIAGQCSLHNSSLYRDLSTDGRWLCWKFDKRAYHAVSIMFRNTDGLMERANHSFTSINSVMIEYISGMKLIKAYNIGSKFFQKYSDAICEENGLSQGIIFFL